MTRMTSLSPWFFEKLHAAAGQHAESALDYSVPAIMRSPIEDWRAGDENAPPAQGYPCLKAGCSSLKAPSPKAAVVAQRPEAMAMFAVPTPSRSRPQAQRASEPGLGPSATTKKHSYGAVNNQQGPDASLKEARQLLRQLALPANEVNGALASNSACRQGGILGAPASSETSSDRQPLREQDVLETAMHRMQAASEVRQMLAKSAQPVKARKGSISAASMVSTQASSSGSPPCSRQSSKGAALGSLAKPRNCA